MFGLPKQVKAARNPDAEQGVNVNHFLFPKTFPLGYRGLSFEGYRPPLAGPAATGVGSYSSPFAPADLLSVGVLTDARNRVSF
jgi:hypothetical protein